MLDSLWQDIRFGFTQISRRFQMSLVIIICLAIGIGPNITLFSLFNNLLLTKPNIEHPDRLVTIKAHRPGRDKGVISTTYPDLVEFNDRVTELEGIFGISSKSASIRLPQGPEFLKVDVVTSNYFDLLGVDADYGEIFHAPETTISGSMPYLIFSHSFWMDRFEGDPSIIGSAIYVNGHEFTVLGVMPKGFHGVLNITEGNIWIPMEMMNVIDPDDPTRLTSNNHFWIMSFAIKKADATIDSINQEIASIDAELQALFPDSNEGRTHTAETFANVPFVSSARKSMLFMGASVIVGLILLVACSSVAALLLSRATQRKQEISVRVSLGASRRRIIRQLLIESFLMTMIASILAFVLSLWIYELMEGSINEIVSMPKSQGVDFAVLSYIVGMTLLTSILFGLIPAIQASKVDLMSSLKDQYQSDGVDIRTSKLRNLFLIIQFSLCTFLLIISGLMLKSLHYLESIDLGFDVENLLTFQTDLSLYGYIDDEKNDFINKIQTELSELPGIENVVMSRTPPFGNDTTGTFIAKFNEEMGADKEVSVLYSKVSTERYFSTLGIALLSGREFVPEDSFALDPKVIINEALAKQLYSDENPLGHYISVGNSKNAYEIIGVAENIANYHVAEIDQPFLYTPLNKRFRHGLTFVIRSKGKPKESLESVKEVLNKLNPNMATNYIKTMEDSFRNSLEKTKALAYISSGLGFLALMLAVIGTYGVVSYRVSMKRHEVGVRLSLGAKPRALVLMLMSSGLKLIVIGCVSGLLISLFGSQLLSSMLEGVSALDVQVFICVPIIMLLVSCSAIYFPARKTSRVDPMLALRYE